MMATSDTPHDLHVFALDETLLALGLWRDQRGILSSKRERKAALKSINFSEPFVLAGSDADPDGGAIISVMSQTSYDPDTGRFEDKITYWRHLPEGNLNADKPEMEDQFVLAIRGQKDPDQSNRDVPIIIPDQIWVNGKNIFTSTRHGGSDSAHSLDKRRTINWAYDISQQIKLHLNEKRPVHELGKILRGASVTGNFTEQSLGAALKFRGLNDKGWDKAESSVHNFFAKALIGVDGLSDDVRFTLPAFDALTPSDRLKVVIGYDPNTVEHLRTMMDGRDLVAADRSGAQYLTQSRHEYDDKIGQHVFKITMQPHNVLDDMQMAAPFDMVSLVFDENKSAATFTLKEARFMGREITDKMAQHRVIGYMQQANRYFAQHEYPPYQDLAVEYGLDKHLDEWHVPPPLKAGGESIWLPVAGAGIDDEIDANGSGPSGGNVFLQRGLDAQSHVDQIAVMDDLPFQPGTKESQFDGIQPDILDPTLRAALKRGILIFSHAHMDHATIEKIAKVTDTDGRGMLQGQKILLKSYDYETVRHKLTTAKVRKEHWPEFIIYDRKDECDVYPDLHQVNDHQYVYRLRDENDNTRAFIQILKTGSDHTLPTDMAMITLCYNNQIGDTYFLDHDAYGYKDRAQKFMREGQLVLADVFDDVELDDLLQAVPSKNKLYISLEECTSLDKMGRTLTNEQVKDNVRTLMKGLPQDKAAIVVPLSGNHEEIKVFSEVWAEEDTLRHYTSVGANLEHRLTVINKQGYDLDLDLKTVDIPHDKLPQEVYDVTLQAVRDFMQKRVDRAQERSSKKSVKLTEKQLLKQDKPYQLFKYIEGRVNAQIKRGNSKPKMLFDLFLNGDENAFKDLAVKRGLVDESEEFEAPKIVITALEDLKKSWSEEDRDPMFDPALWMVRSLVNYSKNLAKEKKASHCGKVHFKTSHSINDTHMYQAIMAQQDQNAVSMTRSAKTVKETFLGDLGHFGAFVTDPFGVTKGQDGTASKSSYGISVLDFDPDVRNSGLKVKAEDAIWIIPQTPSMGDDVRVSQDQLISDLVTNRNATVCHAYRDGTRILNPKEYRSHFERYFRAEGFRVEKDPASGEMYIPDFSMHRDGHRHFLDMVEKQKNKNFKAKAVEAIHIATWTAFERFKEAVSLGGREVRVKNPRNWVGRQYVDDKKSGSYQMAEKSVLDPKFIGVQETAKYGQHFNKIIRLMHFIKHRQDGSNKLNATNVRTKIDGPSRAQQAWKDVNDFKPANDSVPHLRQSKMGPSVADIMPEGQKPRTHLTTKLLHQRKQSQPGDDGTSSPDMEIS